MSELGVSIDIEKSEISSGLNAFILLAFAMGMYTVIYFGTMYMYLTKSSCKRRTVLAVITIQFLCNLVVTGGQWYTTKWQFVDNGDTRDSVYGALFDTPNWIYISGNISTYTCFALADVLLIWRCFFAWGRSFRVISMSLLLIIIEVALFLFLIVSSILNGGVTSSVALAAKIDDVTCAAYFTTFGTSLLTTILIAYRIYSSSRQGPSERGYTRIINIVTQSGAIYSLSSLVIAISLVLPGVNETGNTWGIALDCFMTVLIVIIAGISTTILVARISMLPTNTTFPSGTSVHQSDLHFHARSTYQTDDLEAMEAGPNPIDMDKKLTGGGAQAEGKDQ